MSAGGAGARRRRSSWWRLRWSRAPACRAGSGHSSRSAVWLAQAAACTAGLWLCAGADRCGVCSRRSGRPRRDRDRVCERSADADHGRGRSSDGDGGGRGAGQWTAVMILIPSGVRVWIATGHTDMRRGMNSLALLVQEAFKRDPHGGDLYVFRGKSADHTSFYIPIPICCRSLSLASAAWRAPARTTTISTTGGTDRSS